MRRINLNSVDYPPDRQPEPTSVPPPTPPPPVDPAERLKATHSHMDEQFQKARNIVDVGTMGRAHRRGEAVAYHDERFESSASERTSPFVQGSSGTRPVPANLPPLRIPKLVLQEHRKTHGTQANYILRQVSRSEVDVPRERGQPHQQPQPPLQQNQVPAQYIQHHSCVQSSPNLHSQQHFPPPAQFTAPVQNHVQHPIHYPSHQRMSPHPHAQMQSPAHPSPVPYNVFDSIMDKLGHIMDCHQATLHQQTSVSQHLNSFEMTLASVETTMQAQHESNSQRLASIESTLVKQGAISRRLASVEKVLAASVEQGKQLANHVDVEGRAAKLAKEINKNEDRAGKDNAAGMQNKTIQYLTVLTQRIGDIGHSVTGIKGALGIEDRTSDRASQQRGKSRSFDEVPSTSADGSGLLGRNGSSAGTVIDVDALDGDNGVHSVTPEAMVKPGLRGWAPGRAKSTKASGPGVKGRSIMERLDANEGILMNIAEWFENMHDPHADLSSNTEPTADRNTALPAEGSQELVVGQVASSDPQQHQLTMVASPHHIDAPDLASLSSHTSAFSHHRSQPDTRHTPYDDHTLPHASSSNVSSSSQKGTAHIPINDPAAISPSLKNVTGPPSSVEVDMSMVVDDKLPVADMMNNSKEDEGRNVRPQAGGDAGTTEVDKARNTIQAETPREETGETGVAVDETHMDVSTSPPQAHKAVERGAQKRQTPDSDNARVSEPCKFSMTDLDEITGDGPSSQSLSPPASSNGVRPSISLAAEYLQVPTTLPGGIKPKPSPRTPRTNNAEVSSSRSVARTRSMTNLNASSSAHSSASPAAATSQANDTRPISLPKVATPANIADRAEAFGFSPVNWSHLQALPFDLAELPETATPTRTFYRSQKFDMTPSTSTSISMRTLRTSKRLTASQATASLPKAESKGPSTTSTVESKTKEVETAERAIEGLLTAQARTPQKMLTLDATVSHTPEANLTTPLIIRIPRTTTQKEATSTDTQEKENITAKQAAERAMKGLLKAQAASPRKQYAIDSNIVAEVERSGQPEMSSPTPQSTGSQDEASMPVTLARAYVLSAQPEGSVASLREQALGNAFIYTGVQINSPKMERMPADLEEENPFSEQLDDNDGLMTDNGILTEENSVDEPDLMLVNVVMGDRTGEYAANELRKAGTGHSLDPAAHPQHDTPIDSVPAIIVTDQFDSGELNATSPGIASRALSCMSALTSVPESEANLSPITSRLGSVYHSEAEIASAVSSPQSTKHTTLLPEPTPDEHHRTVSETADCPYESGEQLTEAVVGVVGTGEAKKVADVPFAMSTSSEGVSQVHAHAPMLASQVSGTTDEVHSVQDLLEHTVSSPTRESQLSAGQYIPDASALSTPPPQTYVSIASSYSPEDTGMLFTDEDDGPQENEDEGDSGLPSTNSELMPQPLQEEPERDESLASSSTLPATGKEASRAESPVTEDVLDPEYLLRVKKELDDSPAGFTAAGVTVTPSRKRKTMGSANSAAERLYICISESDETPKRRSIRALKKRKNKRAPSVISISSDENDSAPTQAAVAEPAPASVAPPLSTEADIESVSRSSGSHALKVAALEIKSFGHPAGTSTPPRGRSPESSESAQVGGPENPASTSAVAENTPHVDLLTRALSPVSDLSRSPSPVQVARQPAKKERKKAAVPAPVPAQEAGPSSAVRKYVAKLDAEDDVPIIPMKRRRVSGIAETAAGPSDAPKKPLLVVQKKGMSTAVTKVKRRKTLTDELDEAEEEEEEEEEQPPLKKAKLRKSASKEDDAKVDEESKKQKDPKGKGKMRQQPERSPTKKVKDEHPQTSVRLTRGQPSRRVKWPKILHPNFDQFIQCDRCDNWYHIGCVGIGLNDPRLDDSKSNYACPPCLKAGVSRKDPKSASKNAVFNGETACSRHNCLRFKLFQDGETYIVEDFIGRHRRFDGGMIEKTWYLVKWFGYSTKESTWGTLLTMGLRNPAPFIESFEAAARAEGIDLDVTDDRIQMLQEAIDANCTTIIPDE